MKKIRISLFLIFLSFIFVFSVFNVEARSGCCSHHGGVCGCGCCDGSPLSATCAPYYPECSSPRTYCGDGSCNSTEDCSSCSADCGACPVSNSLKSTDSAQTLPEENVKEVEYPTAADMDNIPISSTNNKKENNNSGNGLMWAGGIGVGVIAGYALFKLRKH
jgi:hypothetical protein